MKQSHYLADDTSFSETYQIGNGHPIPGATYKFSATPVGANDLTAPASSTVIKLRMYLLRIQANFCRPLHKCLHFKYTYIM